MDTVTTTRDACAGPAPGDGVRQHMAGMWSAVAPSWERHADEVDARGAGVAEAMLTRVALRPGERVLELACGPGGLGLAAAARVAPGGEVVLSDVVAEMAGIAGRRARATGAANVRTAVHDIEDIGEPAASFDVVLCREGLMFAADPAQGAREMRRVMRPGGRVAVAVWAERARNPWLGLVLDAASAQMGAPMPPPGRPGPFSLSDPALLADLLAGAGLVEVVVEELPVPMQAATFDEWWTRTCALAGPLATVLAGLPEAASAELRERAREAVAPYADGEALRFPGVTLLAFARAPEEGALS